VAHLRGLRGPPLLRVEQAKRPSAQTWNARECSFLPEWEGTSQAFTLSPSGDGGCDLRFRHEGLHPELECYEMSSTSWDQYVPSLRDYIETGTGNPFRGR
jgi:hypothetical protein